MPWRKRERGGIPLAQRYTHAPAPELCNRGRIGRSKAEADSTETFARRQSEAMHVKQDGAAFDDPSIRTNTLPELERWRATETPECIPYGLAKLDALTGGMYPGGNHDNRRKKRRGQDVADGATGGIVLRAVKPAMCFR